MFRLALLSLCVSLTWALPSTRDQAKAFLSQLKGPRIVNGESAGLGQFPWQAAVFVNGGDGSWFCGGSIISDQWILTAGHCVNGGQSGTIVTGTIDAYAGRLSDAVEFVLHEQYDGNALANDIGLVRINPITLDNLASPIALSSDDLGPGVGVTVSGWGLTSDGASSISETLNFVHLSTISNDQCSQTYGSIRGEVVCCTSDNSQVKSTCSGDSGGPLVINADSNPVHVAVVSFVSSIGCESGAPSGYTRTATYRDWIRQHTGV